VRLDLRLGASRAAVRVAERLRRRVAVRERARRRRVAVRLMHSSRITAAAPCTACKARGTARGQLLHRSVQRLPSRMREGAAVEALGHHTSGDAMRLWDNVSEAFAIDGGKNCPTHGATTMKLPRIVLLTTLSAPCSAGNVPRDVLEIILEHSKDGDDVYVAPARNGWTHLRPCAPPRGCSSGRNMVTTHR